MSKDCKDCEYFTGYDCDGCAECGYEGGFEACPFNDEAEVKNNGVKIEIDSDFLSEYIQHTIFNTVHRTTSDIVHSKISKIVTDEYKAEIKAMTREKMGEIVDRQITKFMDGEIHVGGGWNEPSRKISRNQYLSEEIEKALSEKIDSATIKQVAETQASTAIRKFAENLKREINNNLKSILDEATCQTLTDSVVSLLMANDTYKRLSDSMGRLIGVGDGAKQ